MVTADPDFTDLPQYCKDYTAEQTERVVDWLSRLGLSELRERQSICNEQIGMAYTQWADRTPPEWAVLAMDDLQARSDQLMAAVGCWLDRQSSD